MPCPSLVREAERVATRVGFGKSCSPQFGALLRTLASQVDGTILEIGTGCGVGSAWITSGMRQGSRLVTVERDAGLCAVARDLLPAECEVLEDDWRTALGLGPFRLVFVDIGDAKDQGADEVINALAPGGLVVLDDFSPGPLYLGRHDERWHRWMEHPQLVSCEIQVAPESAAILGAKR